MIMSGDIFWHYSLLHDSMKDIVSMYYSNLVGQ